MGIRKLAALVLLVAAVAYVRCGRDAEPPAAPAAPVGSGAVARASRFDFAARVAARARHIDIVRGELRLEGEAIDEQKQPIAGATITLNGDRTTTSEADGSFAFEDLGAGEYHLVAEKATAYGEDDYTLSATGDPDELTLRVGPTIEFHVVDRAGSPVAGATLSTSRHSDTHSDGDGHAHFRGMELGGARFDVVAAGYASQHFDVDVGDDPAQTIQKKVVLGTAATIGGVVIDQDGKPVPGARVSASTIGGWSDSVDCDDAGRWKVEGFGAGKLAVSASSDVDVALPDEVVQLDGVRPKLDIVVRVERGAAISGMVVDASGTPVAGARVVAGTSSADSDDKGRFLVQGIDPGTTKIEATAEHRGSPIQTVELARGAHLDVRIVVVDSSIAGFVKDAHGEPIADATVSATGPRRAYDRTDEFGHFDLGGIPPGDYTLTASRQDDKGDAPGSVLVHTGNRQVALVLPDESSVTGRVVLDGQPVDYFGVVLADKPDALWDTPDPVRSPDGRFVQNNVQPGTWALIVVGPGFQRTVVKDVVVAGGKPLDLGDIAVVAGRSVRGRVTDGTGAPVAGAMVLVSASTSIDDDVSLRGQVGGERGTHADAAGHFEIDGLPDDLTDLTIQASEPEHGLAVPRALVAADLDADVELELAATGSIAGTLANQKPDTGYSVYAMSFADGRTYAAYIQDGQFELPQLPVGDYSVELRADVVVPIVRVTVAANAATPVAFELPSDTVTVDVEIVNDTCTGVIVTTPDVRDPMAESARWIELAHCTDDHHAEIEHVGPGRYKLCNTGCTVIDVAASPARQSATITEAAEPAEPADPPTPDPTTDPAPAPDEGATPAE